LSLLIVLLVLVLILAVLLVVPRKRSSTGTHATRNADIDEDELLRAEDELSDLDAMATPEDAANELPDWGPGVPKYRKDSSQGTD
jgi:hypothetical protein